MCIRDRDEDIQTLVQIRDTIQSVLQFVQTAANSVPVSYTHLAGSSRNDLILSGQGLLVDGEDNGLQIVACGSRDNDLLAPAWM